MNNTSHLLPAQGRLLISSPSVDDPHFNHSVIYMIDYSDKGEALGVVLNHGTPFTLDRAVDGVRPGLNIPVYAGGPVGNDRLIYLHTLGPLLRNSREVSEGLYLGGELDDAIDYVNSVSEISGFIRFFIGYCGWSRGQLMDEINNDSWVVSEPITPSDLLRQTDNSMWHTMVKSLGEQYKEWKFSPLFPHLN